MKFRLLAAFVCITCFAASAVAQHADIRPYVQDNQLHTAGFVDATSSILPNSRVFGYDFREDPLDPFFIQDPGFNASATSGIPGGSQLLFNIVGAASLGLPSNLSYWDGTGQVVFGAVPNGETLTLKFGSQSRLADNSTATVAGFSIQTATASGSIHRHLESILSAASGDPAAGIYLLALDLLSSDTAIQKSDPFFIAYNNGLDEEVHDAAIDWVQENLVVPEPSTIVLMVGLTLLANGFGMRKRS